MAIHKKGLEDRPHPNARLEHLPYEQHEQLCKWLLAGLSGPAISKKIREEFGFGASVDTINNFYSKYVVQHLAAIRARAVNVAAGYIDAAGKSPAQFTAATMDALEAKAMQACFDPNTKSKDLKVYLDLVCRWHELRLRSDQIALQLKRLKLLERKQKKLEAVLSVESSLTSDEVAERCRIIFKRNGIEPKYKDQEELAVEKHLSDLTPRPPAPLPRALDQRSIPLQNGGASQADRQEFSDGM